MSAIRKIIAVFSFALLFSVVCGAQGQIYTEKARMADFYSRTVKVVLSGDQMLDMVLTDAVKTRWRVSSYELCTQEEYTELKTNASFYFLRVVFKDSEPGLAFLSLSKGGKTTRNTDIDSAFDIIHIPFDRNDFSSGKASYLLPVFVDVIQTYAEDARTREGRKLIGLTLYNRNLARNTYCEMLVAKSDLDDTCGPLPGIRICRAVDVAIALEDGMNCLVGFTVSPEGPHPGARTYKFVVAADTREIYFYRAVPFSPNGGTGFSLNDLSLISRSMNNAVR